MTTKELRKELIYFLTDDWCSVRCRLLVYGPLIESSTISNYVCKLDPEENLGRTESYILLRCQQCIDLFKDS